MVVSQALDPADVDGSLAAPVDDPTYKDKNGQRVVVTINGGGDIAGIGGGTNQISLSAGGTERQQDLDPNAAAFAPTFTAARSRCGGNYGMLIDTSGSIGSTNMGTVRTAVTAFINAFAGTPVKLQLVDFDTRATTLGGDPTTGARYFDMLKDSDVADLKIFVNGGTTSTGAAAVQLTAGGWNQLGRRSEPDVPQDGRVDSDSAPEDDDLLHGRRTDVHPNGAWLDQWHQHGSGSDRASRRLGPDGGRRR